MNQENNNQESKEKSLTKEKNKLRFFYPNEWWQFIGVITNLLHRFLFTFLLNTGLRINEARNIKIKDINLDRKTIIITKPKRAGKKGINQRYVFFSSMFKVELINVINQHKLQDEDKLGFPSTQFLDRRIKQYATKAGLSNPNDFSCHSFRKTLENYLCALNINILTIQGMMGHKINIAAAHYFSQFMKPEEKNMIRSIIGDLFRKE